MGLDKENLSPDSKPPARKAKATKKVTKKLALPVPTSTLPDPAPDCPKPLIETLYYELEGDLRAIKDRLRLIVEQAAVAAGCGGAENGVGGVPRHRGE